ncbi:MAG: hypothetical protein ACI9OJ_002738 [Myxococcota bacterium]|jgi:hypothetical protein
MKPRRSIAPSRPAVVKPKLTIAFGERHLDATCDDDGLVAAVLACVPHATVKLLDKRGRQRDRPDPLTLAADVRLVAHNWGIATLTAELISNGRYRFVFDRLDPEALKKTLSARYDIRVDPNRLPPLRRSLMSRLVKRLRIKAPPGRWGN